MTSIDSDEELLQAALELEHLQLAGHVQEGAPLVAHHQGGGQQDAQHQEAGDQEAGHGPNLKPSQRMTKSHPDGAQGWKGEQHCQATHGQGGQGEVGDVHHRVQDGGEGAHLDQAEGAVGSSPPPTSQIMSQRTPTAKMTPASLSPSRRRVICLHPIMEEEEQGKTIVFLLNRQERKYEISASADGGPRSQV